MHIDRMSLLSKLEASLTEKGALIADRDRAKVDLGAALAANLELSRKLDEAQAEIAALNEKVSAVNKVAFEAQNAAIAIEKQTAIDIAAANQAKDAAEAKAKQLTDNPSAVALEIAAKAGVKPADRPKAAAEQQVSVTRAEFDAMTHPQRNSHIRSGGKVTA